MEGSSVGDGWMVDSTDKWDVVVVEVITMGEDTKQG